MRGYLLTVLAVVLSAGGGYYAGLRHTYANQSAELQALQAQTADLQTKEQKAKEDAESWRADADIWAAKALDARSKAKSRDAEIARLKGEIANLGASLPAGTVVDGSAPIVVLQADLILQLDGKVKDQDTQITALNGQINAQSGQIKSLESALTLADRRADIQAQASKAAFDGLKRNRWLGRAEGFALGCSLGYLGGRLK